MSNIEFSKYCWLLNRIAYWLVVNGKSVYTVDEYSFFGKSKSLKNIISLIKQNKTNYASDVFIARFVEYAIVHSKTYDNFPTSVYSLNNKSRLSREQYIAMVKNVWEYERKNKKHPLTVPIPVIKTYKKYGHATKYGCDNKGQNNGYYCGCHSLQEVFRNLTGIVVPQSTIASWAGTTTDGTDHEGLNTAVAQFNRKYGKNLTVTWYNFSDLGWNKLKAIINSNNQDCVWHNLYRNQWGHYEVVNKIYSDYCDVQNSLGDYCDYGCYCGYVEERSFSTFRSYLGGISQKSIMVITNES